MKHLRDKYVYKAADILIFPILTNANHGIELYLKALTWMLNKKMGEEIRIEGAHKTQATMKQDKMDFSRYPFDNKYENHFYVDQICNVEIDLENFLGRFQAIHQGLEKPSDFLYHFELNQDEISDQ